MICYFCVNCTKKSIKQQCIQIDKEYLLVKDDHKHSENLSPIITFLCIVSVDNREIDKIVPNELFVLSQTNGIKIVE